MIKLSSILVILTLLVGCGNPNQNYSNQGNDLKKEKGNSLSPASKDSLPTLSERIEANELKRDSIQKFLLNSYWKSYNPDSISDYIGEYTFKTQKKIWNSTNFILKGYIDDVIASDKNQVQLIIMDYFSNRYFIVNMTIAQAESILKIDDDHVYAFLLVRDFTYNLQIINELSGWSRTDDGDVDIDYNKKYELVTKCNLIDMVFDEQ